MHMDIEKEQQNLLAEIRALNAKIRSAHATGQTEKRDEFIRALEYKKRRHRHLCKTAAEHEKELIRILDKRFEPCCRGIRSLLCVNGLPSREKEVSDIIWIMLRSHCDPIFREAIIPGRNGTNYRPDFSIPALKTLVEVKCILTATQVSKIQDQIRSKAAIYLDGNKKYKKIIFVVYDRFHKIGDRKTFSRVMESTNKKICRVIVVQM
jgi:hypothetical protein